MPDDALNCIQAFLKSVPAWIVDIENILATAPARQKEIIFEQQPAKPLYGTRRKRSSSSSTCTRRHEDTEDIDKQEVEHAESQAPLLRPQLPHLTDSDVLRLSQRKRKTASVCSGDQSGPRKYRTRSMAVVYYDGDTQKRFETLVKDIGIGRNAVRKGKVGAGMTSLSRSASSGSDHSSEDDEATLDLSKLQYKSVRMMREDPGGGEQNAAAFDQIDTHVEHSQSLCERAAYQILRDGDCAMELNNAKEQLLLARRVAEEELPKLEERSRETAKREPRREEGRGTKEASEDDDGKKHEEDKHADSAPDASPVPSLVPSLPSDGKLEADLEPDDEVSDGESEVLAPSALLAGKYQFRTKYTIICQIGTMTGQKRRSGTAAASLVGKRIKNDESTQGEAPTAKSRKSRKGRIELVEIDTDEEAAETRPRQRGALRGLDTNVVLAPTHPTIEVSDEHEDGDLDDGTLYDLKYHPMDRVTRPKAAATRRSGSLPWSVKFEVEGETSEESAPSEPRDSDFGSEEDADAPAATQRLPDPKASRHSARSGAQTSVNYDMKIHPQDYGVSGFKRNAKRAIALSKAVEKVVSKSPVVAKKRKSHVSVGEGATLFNHDDAISDGDCEDEDDRGPALRDAPTFRPHKKLKSHRSSSPAAVKARSKPGKRQKKHAKVALEKQMRDVDEYLVAAAEGLQDSDAIGSHARSLMVSDDKSAEDDYGSEDEPSADLARLPNVRSPPLTQKRKLFDWSDSRDSKEQNTTDMNYASNSQAQDIQSANVGVAGANTPPDTICLSINKPYLLGRYQSRRLDLQTVVTPAELHSPGPCRIEFISDGANFQEGTIPLRGQLLAPTSAKSLEEVVRKTSSTGIKQRAIPLMVNDSEDEDDAEADLGIDFADQMWMTLSKQLDDRASEDADILGKAAPYPSQDDTASESSHIVPVLDQEEEGSSPSRLLAPIVTNTAIHGNEQGS
ncbi:hypothetical protein LTR53_010671 [Teratosphaeriaceae sp. CCFEE 6253]|nr:hypothetical protein LTR53_010671 [Teratosphaeriaceae sp. CCFEE 6253]